jgi:hypothetical protein
MGATVLYCTYAPSSSQNKRYGQSKQRSRPGRQVQVHAPACALWIVGASRPNKSNWHMVTSGAADNSFRGATTTCLCTFRRPLARYYPLHASYEQYLEAFTAIHFTSCVNPWRALQTPYKLALNGNEDSTLMAWLALSRPALANASYY